MDVVKQIEEGVKTAFIDYKENSELNYRPQFISNDYKEGRKVISTIEEELKNCDEFFISVAFITEGGITPLLQTLKELEKRNVRGRVLTTDYLNFSEPKALRKLNDLSNVEVRMFCVGEDNPGFHTKGYMFREGEIYKIIVGSSNMTMHALSVNKEWNTKIIATEQGEYVREMRIEFEELWYQARPLNDWIETYSRIFEEQRRIARQNPVVELNQYRLEPNTMQVSFVNRLNELIANGERRALLISATGTGKTYASAFALREQRPNKILFLVHREQIAIKAMESYKLIFGNGKTAGVLSGTRREVDCDMLFSTVQTMSRDDQLNSFRKDEFDIIVIDEVHRAGANMHQRVMNYFEPKFYLGMTASPERTDGFDIFALFDNNIAYEIRLKQALQENLLCPFHYFGITDLMVDGEAFDEETGLRNFNLLVSEQRVEHIINYINYYGFSGDRVKGLIFCSTKREAAELSNMFNERGFRTLDLSGEDNQETRADAVERLVSNDRDDYLDYIFTVDIFNEGVDIPEVNQVIMLRPTQSPIVFVQQLGRGLRKNSEKDYVVILDFIGNYKNNFMIPIALSGDNSYNKDTIRRYVSSGSRIIPGSSSIHFDEISRKRIFESIDRAETNRVSLIKEAYINLKNRLGRIPTLKDFDDYGSIDVTKIFDNKSLGSYHEFLLKYEKDDYDIELDANEREVLKYVSTKFGKGKRIHELELLRAMIDDPYNFVEVFENVMSDIYYIDIDDEHLTSTINNISLDFLGNSDRNRISFNLLDVSEDGEYIISDEFFNLVENNSFLKQLKELINFATSRYMENYSDRYEDTNFKLYQKYTYEDVCRLLNWKKNVTALNIGGYFYEKETKTLPVFINYDKEHDAIKYEDRFLSNKDLIALSKKPRDVDSVDADHIYKRTEEDKDNRIYLFVRKNKDDKETKEFYFLGEMVAKGKPMSVNIEGSGEKAFEINYELKKPVREDIFEYIVGE